MRGRFRIQGERYWEEEDAYEIYERLRVTSVTRREELERWWRELRERRGERERREERERYIKERGRVDKWVRWTDVLQERIKAIENGLESYRFGNTPTEDEEISDFATHFLNNDAHRCLMPEITSRLCSSCNNIPITWLLQSSGNGYTLFDNTQQLIESEKSCDFCKLIHRSIKSLDNHGNIEINIAVAPQFLIIEAIQPYNFNHSLLRLCTIPGPEAVSMALEVAFPILPETGGKLYFNLLREWLRDCNETHSDHGIACNADSELPTRVLDIGDVENRHRLRLYHPKKDEKAENVEKGRYIALSHCWGKSKLISTTTASIEAHCKAIKFDDLPKTFQHAVVVTRELGIQFLWIDSLYIIQDDAEDWLREAKYIEKVFALAYCTIAASSAKDSTKGFLTPRPAKQAVRLTNNVYACEVGENFDHDVESAVLNQRGWVLQERALSPRTIHFTATQTYWECGSVIHCENLIQMAKPSNLLSSSRFPITVSGSLSGGAASAIESIYASYSERSLIYPKDRPHAIAGLERRLMDLYKTESTFGIVRCCLGRSLLWQRCGEERMKKIDDPSVEMIPSWSWMKHEGKIHYGNVPKVNTS
jgi:hypothetical protein